MFAEQELQLLEDKIVRTSLNTIGAHDHVPEMDMQIQVIKELMRAHQATLNFPSFTRKTTIELTKHVVMFLNSFPPKIGLSTK